MFREIAEYSRFVAILSGIGGRVIGGGKSIWAKKPAPAIPKVLLWHSELSEQMLNVALDTKQVILGMVLPGNQLHWY